MKVAPFFTSGLLPSLHLTSLTFLAPYPLVSSVRIFVTPSWALFTSRVVVTAQPGARNAVTSNTIKTTAAATIPPMIAMVLVDRCGLPAPN
ncbi:Uncharacterised protein [Mycobacteroides abscessus subsp. massiliense]|nr:Uncharacterised protein [Mycobacteroides abscessus subsp. massiliense]